MASTLFCLVAGLIGGAVSGLLGLGGGALLPPLLSWWLAVNQHVAQGLSLASLLPPVGIPALLAYRQHGVEIRWSFVLWMIAGFVASSPLGGLFAHQLADGPLRRIFAAFLLYSAWRAWQAAKNQAAPSPVEPHHHRCWLAMAIGGAAGFLSGLLGVGGGLVAVPLLRRFGHFGRLEAQATTLAMMLPPIGLPAVLVYAHEQGAVHWAWLVAVAAGFAAGTGLGGWLAGRLPHKGAERFYAGALLIIALLVLRNA